MLALTLNDFDFDVNTVSINKNYAWLDNEDLILEPKTPKSKRKVTLSPFDCDLIKSYAEKLVDYELNERLFTVTKHYLKHEMDRGCKKSGVKVIRIHDLRHSHASLLIEMGFSPLLISERLGHEDIETTLQTYSHLCPNKQGEVAERLQSFLTLFCVPFVYSEVKKKAANPVFIKVCGRIFVIPTLQRIRRKGYYNT